MIRDYSMLEKINEIFHYYGHKPINQQQLNEILSLFDTQTKFDDGTPVEVYEQYME